LNHVLVAVHINVSVKLDVDFLLTITELTLTALEADEVSAYLLISTFFSQGQVTVGVGQHEMSTDHV